MHFSVFVFQSQFVGNLYVMDLFNACRWKVLKCIELDETLTYASETWTLTNQDRKQLNIF